MLYKDMILKLEYHKNRIIQLFIKQGYFPRQDEINEKLKSIDERLALFKSYKFIPGEKVNVKELNHNLEMLYLDIKFLYEIVQDLYIEKYNTMVLNIETHMIYLESLADYFKKRGHEEINSTSLGRTIMFKTDNFDIEVKDETIEIGAGEIELLEGSEIACFANINNTDKTNIMFKFKAANNSKDFIALPYNYNNETYLVPGELTINEHDYTLSDNFNVNDNIIIPIETNVNNSYKILGGKNKMIITDKVTGNISIADFPTSDNPFVAVNNCYISFYVENKSNIEYSFSEKPYHTNFSLQNGLIKTTKPIQKIFLDVPKDFNCYFHIDNDEGKVWAELDEGILDGPNLIYRGTTLVRDFKIKEYVKDKKTKYSVYVVITEMDNDEDIDSIYIKEIE